MTLAKRVRDCRFAKGWGPDELSQRAEISRTALYQIESGKTEVPRAATLRRIAKALGMSMDVFLADLGTRGESEGRPESNSKPHPSPAVDEGAFRYPVEGRMGEVASHFEDATHRFAEGVYSAPRHLGRGGPDLEAKFHQVIASPLGEGLARIVEESYRLVIDRRYPLNA
jgi:transcriptional regulator with XRE-family HTH domain